MSRLYSLLEQRLLRILVAKSRKELANVFVCNSSGLMVSVDGGMFKHIVQESIQIENIPDLKAYKIEQ